jgi:hypothetical protein
MAITERTNFVYLSILPPLRIIPEFCTGIEKMLVKPSGNPANKGDYQYKP